MSQQSGSSRAAEESAPQAYKVLRNDQVGRYMVTSRELQAGEEVVTEMPFVVGPKACTYPLCLACYTPWPPSPDDKPLCSKCGWPVCGEECENLLQHKDYECQVNATIEHRRKIEESLVQNHSNERKIGGINGIITRFCTRRIRLRTTLKVPAGGELYASYTHSLLPTMLRREHLQEGKHFACACPRCSDPTELGTHMSSLRCNKCDNGVVLPLDSLDPASSWKCTNCEFSTNGQAVRKVLRIIQAEVDNAEAISGADGADAIYVRETVMKKYQSVLHPRHAFLTMLRHSLSQMYGRVDEYLLDDLPDVVLEHKIDICHLLLQVLDVVEPGYTRVRGMTLYELHAPLLFLAKSHWNAGVISEASLKSKMTEAANVLKEAAMILILESLETVEGQIGLVAQESLLQLEQSINNL
ncbi:uncharacterized protein LOC116844767 [Odontomachus brunneus]|uniref:uncharacterized protein LOC116844767 n=1 Tax=Odontomachus brunneus TaxID=486640 RepID=UPI0013F197FA|nr:uncharacterized protein LOC116844767 [Odontomachus brunneus]